MNTVDFKACTGMGPANVWVIVEHHEAEPDVGLQESFEVQAVYKLGEEGNLLGDDISDALSEAQHDELAAQAKVEMERQARQAADDAAAELFDSMELWGKAA